MTAKIKKIDRLPLSHDLSRYTYLPGNDRRNNNFDFCQSEVKAFARKSTFGKP